MLATEDALTASEAFDALYRRTYDPLVRLAHLLLGGAPGAEDVVHDVFVRFRQHHGRIDNADAYLRRSVANGCTDLHRRAALDRDRLPRAAEPEAVTHVPELDETWDVLRRLPERQRHALVLRFYEDLCEADIAAVLGCRPGTVKSLVHRGLATLKEALA